MRQRSSPASAASLSSSLTFHIFIFFSQTAARIPFKFCVEVPQGEFYQVCSNRGATPIFQGIMGNFVQFLVSSLKIFFSETAGQNSFKFGQ